MENNYSVWINSNESKKSKKKSGIYGSLNKYQEKELELIEKDIILKSKKEKIDKDKQKMKLKEEKNYEDKNKLKAKLDELNKQTEIIKIKLKGINEIESIIKKGRKIIKKNLLYLKPYL